MELNKTTLGLAAGIAATTIIGYCIYFDKKRRSDPDYKKKVRERRRCARQNAGKPKITIPDLSDVEAMKNFFMQEVQLGENLIAQGIFEEGVEHFAVAVMLCAQPEHMLRTLQMQLPADVFVMLLKKMRDLANQGAENGAKIVNASASTSNSLDFASNTNEMIDTLE